MANGINKKYFLEAQKYLAGGVNSPVRSFSAIGGYPIFIKKGKGIRIIGENGKTYIDYCLSWGALILGHAYPLVIKEVKEIINRGTSFGAPTKLETELARTIIQAFPSIELLRLVNSGTEAIMSAIRIARAYTRKNKVVIFEGAYHGHVDYLLTNSQGIPSEFFKYTIKLPYNDLSAVEKALAKNYKDIAAVLVEPVAGNMGVIVPEKEFLEGLRKLTSKYGVLLIFDEVITGFRITYGGVQHLFNIEPDLTCLGKIIGGGFPLAAYGGRKDIMQQVAPIGLVYQAGTLSGNPVGVTAGLVTLNILRQLKPYKKLKEKTESLSTFIEESAIENKIDIKVNRFTSMFSIFFSRKKIKDYMSAKEADVNIYKIFYKELLQQGVYFSPSPLEANFISVAHSVQDLDETRKVIKTAFKKMWRIKQ